MALGIYSRPQEDYCLSSGTHQKPFTVTFDVKNTSAYDSLLYVRNDDLARYYESITVTPVDISGGALVNGTDGFSWKLSATTRCPFAEEWLVITPGAAISLSNIGSTTLGDVSTYLMFWVRVEVKRWQPVHANISVVLRISATEHLVGY